MFCSGTLSSVPLCSALLCDLYCVLCAPCSVLRAPCSVLRAPCSVLRVPCSVLRAPCSVLGALFSVFRAPCSVLRAPCSVLRAPCSVLRGRAPASALCPLPSGLGTVGSVSCSWKVLLIIISVMQFSHNERHLATRFIFSSAF